MVEPRRAATAEQPTSIAELKPTLTAKQEQAPVTEAESALIVDSKPATVARLTKASTAEPKPALTAESEEAAAAQAKLDLIADGESRIEALLEEQTQIFRDMLKKLKEIRRKLPPPSQAKGQEKTKQPRDKSQQRDKFQRGGKPMRIKANSQR